MTMDNEEYWECYLCGRELTSHDDSGRCQTCCEREQENGDGWDN